MRGKVTFTNVKTRADYELLGDEDKLEFRKLLKGTILKQRDVSVYPDGYDFTLKDVDDGYIAPVFESYNDTTTISRFGFTENEL